MTPTNKLRFVERAEKKWDFDLKENITILKRVLQQWWEDPKTVAYTGDSRDLVPIGEWVDVPLEEEL